MIRKMVARKGMETKKAREYNIIMMKENYGLRNNLLV